MKILIVIILLIATCSSYADTTIGGITVASSKNIAGKQLILNGVGTREKFWMDMYVGALYLQQKSGDPNSIIQANDPMMIELTIVSGLISSEKMKNAVDEGFEKSTDGSIASLQAKIQQFKNAFKDEIKKGDVYTMMYEPSKGTSIFKNGKLSTTIVGHDFKKALFGIWLCDDPADKDLKKAMLGK